MATKLEALGVKRTKRKGRVRQVSAPVILERLYLKELRRIVKQTQRLINQRLLPELIKQSAAVTDGLTVDQSSKSIRRIIQGITIEMGKVTSRPALKKQLELLFGKVAASNKAGMKRQFKQLIGIDLFGDPKLNKLVDAYIKDNIKLIESIPTQYLKEVEVIASESIKAGRRAESIVGELAKRFGVTERRAMVIARDQISKANSQINQSRQTDLGIVEYIWRTAKDERVRTDETAGPGRGHAEREGKTFRWDTPPPDGHPGEPVNCRCTPEPVLPDL